MHEHRHARPDDHILQQSMVGRQVDSQETCRRLKVESVRLGPDQIGLSTNVSGIAVEEGDPKHRVAGLDVRDLTASLFHPS
jgi:hypothetical protein